MKFGKKLGLVAAAMLAVSPVALSATVSQPVAAATSNDSEAYMQKRLKFVQDMSDNIVVVDSVTSQNVVGTLNFAPSTGHTTFKPDTKGSNKAGVYTYSEGVKIGGFPKLSKSRNYNILYISDQEKHEGQPIGRVTVPANSTKGTGFIHFTVNFANDEFTLPTFVDEPVSYQNPNAKKSKKSKKSTKKSSKKSKKSKKSAKKAKKSKKSKKSAK